MSEPAITPRQYGLAAGLGLAVAATLWAAQIEDDEGPAAMPAARRTLRATAAALAEPQRGSSTATRQAWAAPASLAAWAPPPPPPPPPAVRLPVDAPAAPPAPPQPPAFPYQLIGRLEETGGQPLALLAGNTRTLAVRAGEVLDGQWQVERIDAQGLTLIWLPSRLPHTIAFKPVP